MFILCETSYPTDGVSEVIMLSLSLIFVLQPLLNRQQSKILTVICLVNHKYKWVKYNMVQQDHLTLVQYEPLVVHGVKYPVTFYWPVDFCAWCHRLWLQSSAVSLSDFLHNLICSVQLDMTFVKIGEGGKYSPWSIAESCLWDGCNMPGEIMSIVQNCYSELRQLRCSQNTPQMRLVDPRVNSVIFSIVSLNWIRI